MQWLVISGSRNSNGQTASATTAFIEGARHAGHAVEEIYLPTMHIESCRQCNDTGWGLCFEKARCVIEDELAAIVEKIRAADFVVFATPVYFGDLSESMKAFTDRFRRICIHGANKDRIGGKPAVGICVAGGSGGGSAHCALNLETVLTICGFHVVDMVPIRRQNLEMKMEMLRVSGKWFATKSV
jgi:multimeric flavodoxin WrbA